MPKPNTNRYPTATTTEREAEHESKQDANRDDKPRNDKQPNDKPPNDKKHIVTRFFDHFAARITQWAGSPIAFGSALIGVLIWAATGPLFDYSETWQLVINTGTTIVTFLMVFLIQQSQNKDGRAIHLKLDELLIALKGADEELVDAEQLDEDKLLALAAACTARAQAQARSDRNKKRKSKSPTAPRKSVRSSLRVRRTVLGAGKAVRP